MDNSTHDMSDKLLQYLDGELPEEEKTVLERMLASDKALEGELENLKLAREAVRSYGLKQHVARVHEEVMKANKSPVKNIFVQRRLIRYSIAIAASIVVVIIATVLLKSTPASAEELFADNYRSYELSTPRDASVTETAVESAYKEKNYPQVIALADTATAIKPIFLSAMSYLELRDDTRAIERLRSVINMNVASGTKLFKEESEYYLALAYLRNKNYDQALELLSQIRVDKSHLYHERITDKLIQDVKKLR